MDKAVLSKLENGQHGIPTLPSLARYAQAIGLRLSFSLTPATEEADRRVPGTNGTSTLSLLFPIT